MTATAAPAAWYGDSAYGTGDLRDAIREAGHEAVIKPKPLRPAVEGGFTVDDFTVDEEAGTVTCPAGTHRPVSRTRTVTFGARAATARCASGAPPARPAASSSCTSTTTCCGGPPRLGRRRRAARGLHAAPAQRGTRHRPGRHRRGRRLKLRYRGTTRNNAWLKRRTAALNLRNLIGRGLTRQHGTWALAT